MTDAKNKHEAAMLWLAWDGWLMRTPSSWRPVKLEASADRGKVLLGDGSQAIARIRWWRPQAEFNAVRWARARGDYVGALGGDRRFCPPAEQFKTLRWHGSDERKGRIFWAGFSRRAGLMVEAAVNASADASVQKRFCRTVLPSLSARRLGSATAWSVFETGFWSPSGFAAVAWKLNVGHVAIKLEGPNGRRLVLRQVYPAELALTRRKLKDWLRFYGFKEARTFRPAGEPEEWSVNSFGRSLHGLIHRGHKRFGWPFGRIMARCSAAAGVVDQDLDRLLLAECDWAADDCTEQLAWALGSMNWATLAGEVVPAPLAEAG